MYSKEFRDWIKKEHNISSIEKDGNYYWFIRVDYPVEILELIADDENTWLGEDIVHLDRYINIIVKESLIESLKVTFDKRRKNG